MENMQEEDKVKQQQTETLACPSGIKALIKSYQSCDMMTRQEEEELGRRILTGKKEDATEEEKEDALKASQQVALSSWRYILNVAGKYKGTCSLDLEDLFHEGLIAAMTAAPEWDYRKVCFVTYVGRMVDWRILRAVNRDGTGFPEHMIGKRKDYLTWSEEYHIEHGTEPPVEEIMERYTCRKNTAAALRRSSRNVVHPDGWTKNGDPDEDNENSCAFDAVFGKSNSAEKDALDKMSYTAESTARILSEHMGEKTASAFTARVLFGEGYRPLSYTGVGRALGMSHENARRHIKRAEAYIADNRNQVAKDLGLI